MSGTLDAAVARAAADAAALRDAPAPVVLLSPACASYDQFKDFEQRGDAFRALVRAASDAMPMRGGVMSLSRADKSGFANWWFTVDRVALVAHAGADRHRPDAGLRRQPRHHRRPADAPAISAMPRKQVAFAVIAAGILGGASLLSLRQIKHRWRR